MIGLRENSNGRIMRRMHTIEKPIQGELPLFGGHGKAWLRDRSSLSMLLNLLRIEGHLPDRGGNALNELGGMAVNSLLRIGRLISEFFGDSRWEKSKEW